ncbi:MAG: UDP-N-acetylmuramoyl-tripeptide--D-alanyl-D-alanine ligase [Bdellovibrio sp.]|nr:UDP-N-acetylmuramoyl-tripeptide--D-alanyl-D-alanine ligase [Bdellovibrio sp.]
MKWTLEQIKTWTNGKILSTVHQNFDSIGTDTRADLTGKVFVALKGDSYDAHDYLDQAVQKGAAALLVHRLDPKFADLKDKVSIIEVGDTLTGLQEFAHGYRKTLDTKIIAITGSNGKTTTKEFTAQILSTFKKTHYNKGSFNNHWGVPMTLLEITPDTAFAVVEMGMNHAGEITKLVQIADPDYVVCTMVGTAHIEFFGTQKNIADAKAEIYMESRPDTVRIFNQDQDLTFDMMYPVARKFPDSRMLSFSSRNNEADVYMQIDSLSMRGMHVSGLINTKANDADIPIFGKHNLVNLMAAATLAYAVRMPPELIWAALPLCKTAWGRNQFIQTAIGAEILFDGYNANPDSMTALLENIPLLKVEGKKIGVFGQMKELGAEAINAHREIGEKAGKVGFAQIYFIGEDAKHFEEGVRTSGFSGDILIKSTFDSSLGEKLKSSLGRGDIVVVKGSRGAETERFVEFCDPLNWTTKK